MQDKKVENWVFFANMLSINCSLNELTNLIHEACDLSKKTEEFHYLSGLLEVRTLHEGILHQSKPTIVADTAFAHSFGKVEEVKNYEELVFWIDAISFSTLSLYQLDKLFEVATCSFDRLKQKNIPKDDSALIELTELINFLAGFNDGLLICQQAKGCQKALDSDEAA